MLHAGSTRSWGRRRAAILTAALLAPAVPAAAQEQAQTGGHVHEGEAAPQHAGLHFTHPLVAESVSPDTKLRLDFGRRDLGGEAESEMELEAEYALHRSFAVEVGVHFEPAEGRFGETHVIAKFANYAFEGAGVLLGYGMELGLPTGAAHGHGGLEGPEHEHLEGEEPQVEEPAPDENVYEFAPFLNAGLATGSWEVSAWTRYAIPTNQVEPADRGPELRYSLSALLHATPRLQPVLELSGAAGLGGPSADRETVALTPGLRIRPFLDQPLVVGGAVTVPITDERAFDSRFLLSAFWHF